MRLFVPEICPLDLQPRILGLSASLVDDKVGNAYDLDVQIKNLERLLHCRGKRRQTLMCAYYNAYTISSGFIYSAR